MIHVIGSARYTNVKSSASLKHVAFLWYPFTLLSITVTTQWTFNINIIPIYLTVFSKRFQYYQLLWLLKHPAIHKQGKPEGKNSFSFRKPDFHLRLLSPLKNVNKWVNVDCARVETCLYLSLCENSLKIQSVFLRSIAPWSYLRKTNCSQQKQLRIKRRL